MDIVPAVVGPITELVQAVGTLKAMAPIIVRPEIAGMIRRIHCKDGQFAGE